jgi:large subunit ribosomal protein L14
MIKNQTLLNVTDNSGAKLVRCLKILKKGYNSRYCSIGDVILGSVIKLRLKNRYLSKVKKGDLVLGVIVRCRAFIKRKIGLNFSFSTNSIILINKQRKPIGSRILGLVAFELRAKKFSKIMSMARGII